MLLLLLLLKGGGRGGFKGGAKVTIEPHRHEGNFERLKCCDI